MKAITLTVVALLVSCALLAPKYSKAKADAKADGVVTAKEKGDMKDAGKEDAAEWLGLAVAILTGGGTLAAARMLPNRFLLGKERADKLEA
jgi:hypothetical protein